MQKKLTIDGDLEAGYELMAQDEAREAEALEWIEGTVGEITVGAGASVDSLLESFSGVNSKSGKFRNNRNSR